MTRVTVYTTRWCAACDRAKDLLARRGIPYDEFHLDADPAFRQTVFDLGGQWSVPLVLIDGQPVGGYRELAALDASGRLDERLAA